MILVSGSLAYDRIMNFPGYFRDRLLLDKLHVLSVAFGIDRIDEHFGGTAGNIAYNLALLGETPVLLGSAGNDYAPYRAWQKKNRVDTSLVRIIKDDRTASAYIMTDKADNQITAFHPGAMAYRVTCNVKRVTRSAKIAIVSPGNSDDMRRLPVLYKKYGVPYIYDPGQAIPALSKRDLILGMTGAKVFILNDYELALVQEKTGFTKKQILSRVGMLVTTLGEKGSMIEGSHRLFPERIRQLAEKSKGTSTSSVHTYVIPAAKPKKVVDPTGAGDAYRAGFIYGLLRDWPIERIGRFAATVAVYTVEKVGTQTHVFSWKNIRERYRNNFHASL